jgi:predicted Ser/Thr protein kinase
MPDPLNDRYELGEIVGSGGMGSVHRATDLRLGRTVAVKVLRDGPMADDVARSRMHSEARLAASIHHPGVAQVFDFGEVLPSGPTFLVMQFVEGHTLAQLLRDQGPMSPDQVMSVVVQVAEGLQACHDAGVVHRDLKPANIMLTPAGRTMLVDFGIARSATSEPLTDTGAMIGTADYMSPEQAAGRPATAQSDLYALGVVAYHCLTGTSPFRRDSAIATALAHLNDGLPPFGPEVPADVAALIEQLTSTNPADRPTSAAAVALQAAAVGADRAIDLPRTFEPTVSSPPSGETVVAVEPAVTRVGAATDPGTDPGRTARRRRPMVAYAGIGLFVIALALLGVQRFQPDEVPVVPDVVGLSVDDAKAQIRDAGLTATARTVDRAGQAAGEVVEQKPAAGQSDEGDDPVQISVTSGKVSVSADDVIGKTYAAAAAALERLGLEVTRKEISQSTKVGEVVALDKSGRLPIDSTVVLSVAVAPVAPPAPAPAQPQPVRSPTTTSGSGGASGGATNAERKAGGKNDTKKKNGKNSKNKGKK